MSEKDKGLIIGSKKLVSVRALRDSGNLKALIGAYAEEAFHDLREADKEIDRLEHEVIVHVYVVK